MKQLTLRTLAVMTALSLTACGTSQPSAKDGGTEGGGGGEPITVTDDAGRTVELDAPPERVVTLEWQQTEDVLTLGVDPVGVADVKGYNTWVKAAPLDASTKNVGKRGEPNLDAVFSTNPDLVIVETSRGDAVIDKLEKYDVPILVTTGADTKDPVKQMKDTLTLISKALGKEQQAKTAIKAFDRTVADARESVAEARPEKQKFVYTDAFVEGSNVSIRPFGQGSLVGELGEDIGLKNAWTGKVDPVYGLGQTDIEGITAVEDVHYFHTSTDSDTWLPKLEKNPLWKKADFVQNDSVHAVDTGVWTFGGPRSSADVAEQLAAGVTKSHSGS